jgi:hypothetical protein
MKESGDYEAKEEKTKERQAIKQAVKELMIYIRNVFH